MTMKRMLLSAVVLLLPAAVQAQVKITHEPEYKSGEVIRTVSEIKTNQTLVIAGMNVDTKAEVFTATKETPGEMASDGKLPMKGEFEYYIVNLTTPAGNVAFDSGNPDGIKADGPLGPFADLFKAAAKATWTTTLKGNQVESVEYIGEPFKDLAPELQREVKAERFKKEYEMQLARFPEGAVSPGDTWKRTEEPELGGGQSFKMEKEYTYVGPETVGGKTYDKIGVKVLKCLYHMDAQGGSPLKADDADLAVVESDGTILYDRENHTFTSTSEKVRLKGDLKLKIDINGQTQELAGNVDLTMESKSTIELP
jgi:hypothetical protein